MQKLKAEQFNDIAQVEIISAVPGNSWEEGKHNIMPSGRAPKFVEKGRTYLMRITHKLTDKTWDVPYSIGSGLTFDKNGREIHPSVEDILMSVYHDAATIESNSTFEDFCDDLGYDTDSRKALSLYLEGQETYTKFNQFFFEDDRKAISELAEEW